MSWAERPERGGALPTRLGWAIVSRLGWPAGRALAWVCAAWFLVTAREARLASASYLTRALGREAGLRDVARHFRAFADAVLDRVLLLSGRDAGYAIETEGLEALDAALRAGRGAVLLGAHLGSFEVLRTLSRRAPVPVRPLMYRRNGGALTSLLDRLAPGLRAQVLEIGGTAGLIAARECVERGEMVAILADRGPSAHRRVAASFLGAVAQFPAGPFIFAATLDAPVFLCHAVSVGPRRYRIGITPFAERVVLRRERRDADLRELVAGYAAALEALCLAYPFQWFNFFPFWEHDEHRSGSAQPAASAARPGVASTG